MPPDHSCYEPEAYILNLTFEILNYFFFLP